MSDSPAVMVLDLETVLDESMPPPPAKGESEKRAPFPPPPLHSVVCAAFSLLSAEYIIQRWGVLDVGSGGWSEEQIVRQLVETISVVDPVVVTCNGRQFDLPVLAARCYVYGIPFPWYYGKRFGARYRYSREETYDVMDHLSDHGAAPRASVHVWSVACGWPGKVGGEDGKTVAVRVAAGDLRGVAEYCLGDVAEETAIFLRAELVRGTLGLEGYQAAARALLDYAEADPRTAALAFAVDRKRFLLEDDSRLDDAAREAAAEEDWRRVPEEAGR